MENRSHPHIQIGELPLAFNVCGQELREVWKSRDGKASLAHVKMQPGAVSLLHKHEQMEEVYHILYGRGFLTVGDDVWEVSADSVVEIPIGVAHKLQNSPDDILIHTVLAIPAFDPQDVYLLEE